METKELYRTAVIPVTVPAVYSMYSTVGRKGIAVAVKPLNLEISADRAQVNFSTVLLVRNRGVAACCQPTDHNSKNLELLRAGQYIINAVGQQPGLLCYKNGKSKPCAGY